MKQFKTAKRRLAREQRQRELVARIRAGERTNGAGPDPDGYDGRPANARAMAVDPSPHQASGATGVKHR